MAGENNDRLPVRRQFLTRIAAGAAGSGLVLGKKARADNAITEPASPLPTIRIGDHLITRLVAGWNPIGGYSYLGPNLNRHMAEYFTPEHILGYLRRCEAAGINAHQFSKPEKMADVLRALRAGGSAMKFICLHSGGSEKMPVKKVVERTQPVAIVHHGGVTDRLFREGKSGEVHDFVKRVQDAGVLAGVSAHNPDCIKQVADEGWGNDLFMTCFYHLTRTPAELEEMPPVVTVQSGYPFFTSDPLRMTEVIRQIDRPCLGFKILAAGRLCNHKNSVRQAFQFAFQHIKPTDGVIVGMYPRFHDEIQENAEHVRHCGMPADS
jgi:hypothetical protein